MTHPVYPSSPLRRAPYRHSRGFYRPIRIVPLLMNPDTILGYNQTFVPGGAWLRPTSVMTARTVKFTLQHDF